MNGDESLGNLNLSAARKIPAIRCVAEILSKSAARKGNKLNFSCKVTIIFSLCGVHYRVSPIVLRRRPNGPGKNRLKRADLCRALRHLCFFASNSSTLKVANVLSRLPACNSTCRGFGRQGPSIYVICVVTYGRFQGRSEVGEAVAEITRRSFKQGVGNAVAVTKQRYTCPRAASRS